MATKVGLVAGVEQVKNVAVKIGEIEVAQSLMDAADTTAAIWTSCGRRGGPCRACNNVGNACCRKGWKADPIECGKGMKEFHGYYCCVKQATESECGSKIDENWRLLNIKYHIERGNITNRPPKVAGNQFIDNRNSTYPQTIKFFPTESYEESKSFTHTAGISMTVGTSSKVGCPSIAEGKIEASITASYEFSYGETETTRKSISSEYSCTAPPGMYRWSLPVDFCGFSPNKLVSYLLPLNIFYKKSSSNTEKKILTLLLF